MFFVFLLWWTWRGADWIAAAGWATFGVLLTSTWLLPWYAGWVVPLAAVEEDQLAWALALAFTAYLLPDGVPL